MKKAKTRLSNVQTFQYRVRQNANSIISIAVIITFFLMGVAIGYYLAYEPEMVSPIIDPPRFMQVQASTQAGQKHENLAKPAATLGALLYSGKISYYSHAGCLGCHPQQLMGNGKPFDENAMTLAVPCEDVIKPAKVRYNTRVIVTNTDTNKSVEATITDCGGFSKYNRVADLSLGLARELDAKTDQTNISINLLGGQND